MQIVFRLTHTLFNYNNINLYMLILFDNEGQTCNKFWGYISQIKKSLSTGITLYIPFYDVTIDDYPRFRDCNFIKFPFYSNFLNESIGIKKYNRRLASIVHSRFYDARAWLIKTFPKHFVNAWDERSVSYNDDEKQFIKDLFTPKNEITQSVILLLDQIKSEDKIVVGVHIRWGDYRTLANGRFFYSLEQYKQLCESFISQYGNATFLICSNEEISLDFFSPLKCINIPNGTATHDLYALSQCDYIFGPPSSYSKWASFVGEVPLHFVNDVVQSQNKMTFKVVEDYSYYQDGTPIEY